MISEIKALPKIRLGLLLLRFALGFGSLAPLDYFIENMVQWDTRSLSKFTE